MSSRRDALRPDAQPLLSNESDFQTASSSSTFRLIASSIDQVPQSIDHLAPLSQCVSASNRSADVSGDVSLRPRATVGRALGQCMRNGVYLCQGKCGQKKKGKLAAEDARWSWARFLPSWLSINEIITVDCFRNGSSPCGALQSTNVARRFKLSALSALS